MVTVFDCGLLLRWQDWSWLRRSSAANPSAFMKQPVYIKVKTLDGVEVEVTHCDAGFPPGSVGGQCVNTMSVWIRPAGKDWIRTTLRSAMAVCGEIKHTNLVDLESKIGVNGVVTKASSS